MRESVLPSFGEKLKQEREKRQITLEQISISTKIGTRMLQALEEDKFNQLPGGIFNKGFVRAYSRVVGLDEDQTVAEYLQASGDAPPVRTELVGHETEGRENEARESNTSNNTSNNNEEKVRRLEASADDSARPLPWGWFAAVLLVVALALSFWSHRERERARESVAPTSTTTATPEVANGGSSGVASGSMNNGGTGSATATSPANGSPETALPTVKSAPSVAPKTSQDLPPAVAAAAPGEFTLVIQAREESWMSINADGKSIPSELLLAGSERTVRGRKEIVVRAGNAGAVDFLLNGKKLDTGGDYGEVKTLTFGPGGILPNATAPSTP
jgi:cytoskeletal protein RodZ